MKKIIIKIIKKLENNKDATWFISYSNGNRITKVFIYNTTTKKEVYDAYDSQRNGRWNIFFNQ